MDLPSISIVTICRNAEHCLSRAIESVIASGYPNLQYVVVDGQSTDGTLAVIEKYSAFIDRFVSEPDDGISDAMNKGISLSDGTFHYLLHADDILQPGALHLLAKAATKTSQVVCGNVRVNDGIKTIRVFRPVPKKLSEKMSIPHMGCIVRKDAWSSVGGYDTRRRVAMDHLFFLKIAQQFGEQSFAIVDTLVAEYSLGGVSDRRIFEGFSEVRANLVEMGYNSVWAQYAFAKLCLKALIASAVR